MDYAGFVLITCNKSNQKDLQIIQNTILRCCYNVRLLDRLTLVDMHREASLVSLEHRRQIQLPGLMYIYTRIVGMLKEYLLEILDRVNVITSLQTIFKVENTKVFHISKELFYGTPADNVITLPTLIELKRIIKRHFYPFNEDLL